ncbi:MAG: glycosyltransferase family A protein [Pseudomonadota bacterium]|nr:glycosyltransferase family A protein [Pseudomonadota bacterium]
MTAAPLVSCIVPAFNSERYLAEAIDSILAQTYQPIEVIVVDDGSVDGTSDIARCYGPPVRLVTKSTQGPAATRNLGLHIARGTFVAFLDADDLWHREKLALQMARFETRPELEVSVTHAQMFWIDALENEARTYDDTTRTGAIPGYATTTVLARRSLFERIGDFDTGLWFSDATDWFVRVTEAGAVLELMDDVLVYHRMHERNLTRRRSDASRDEFLMIAKRVLDRRREATPTRVANTPPLAAQVRDDDHPAEGET